MIILERGPLPRLVLTSDILRSIYLEGCISGNVPQGKTPPGGPNGPCGQLARSNVPEPAASDHDMPLLV